MGNAAVYEAQHISKVDDLLNANYCPFTVSNMDEAIERMSDVQKQTHAVLLATDPAEAGRFLAKIVMDFWTRLARSEATARLEDECQNCYGAGCSFCKSKD